ncbi:hypothetical protein TcBrA4_0023570 [Trypanosoma cruzi]|nr:hypothetical protein TcBrA4_0023570 [Trypanosoma cruzi]
MCGRASRGPSGAQWLVRVAVAEWLKGYGCHWSLRSCAVLFLLVDTLDIFGSGLRVRHLLGRPWSCRRIRMRGLLQRLESQSGHVGRVPSYCGRTRRLCHRLGRATLTCCSLFYEEVPWTRQVEVPEAVGVNPSPQCGRSSTTEIKSHLQSAWHVPVCRGMDRRTSMSRLFFGKEWRAHVREDVRRRQSTDRRSQQHRSTADPRRQGCGAATPRGIKGLGIERAPSCFARTSSSMEKPRRRA